MTACHDKIYEILSVSRGRVKVTENIELGLQLYHFENRLCLWKFVSCHAFILCFSVYNDAERKKEKFQTWGSNQGLFLCNK